MDTSSAAARPRRCSVPEPRLARARVASASRRWWPTGTGSRRSSSSAATTTDVGHARRRDRRQPIELVTSLDPWVDHPYRFAAIWLTDSADEVRRANRLLEKALSYHPRDWRNRFYLGYNQFFYLAASTRAPRARSSPRCDMPGAPTYLGPLVTRLRAEGGDLDTAALFLQELIRTAPDEYARAEYLEGARRDRDRAPRAPARPRARRVRRSATVATCASRPSCGRGRCA